MPMVTEANCTYDDFRQAVCTFSLEKLQAMSYPDGYLNQRDEKGFSILHYAAQRDAPDIVAYLMQAGARCGMSTENQLTPLDCAIMNGHYHVLKTVLQQLGDRQLCAQHASHALLLSVEKGDWPMVNLLLHCHANVAITNARQQNILHICVLAKKTNLLVRLLEKNIPEALIDAEDNFYHLSPLELSMVQGCTEIVEILKQKKNQFTCHAIIEEAKRWRKKGLSEQGAVQFALGELGFYQRRATDNSKEIIRALTRILLEIIKDPIWIAMLYEKIISSISVLEIREYCEAKASLPALEKNRELILVLAMALRQQKSTSKESFDYYAVRQFFRSLPLFFQEEKYLLWQGKMAEYIREEIHQLTIQGVKYSAWCDASFWQNNSLSHRIIVTKESQVLSARQDAKVLYNIGVMMLSSGFYQESLSFLSLSLVCYEQQITAVSEKATCFSALASVYRELHQYNQAIHYCEKAIKAFTLCGNVVGKTHSEEKMKGIQQACTTVVLKS